MLLASSILVLLLLSAGTAAAGLGYLPWGTGSAMMTDVQPAAEDPPEAPETSSEESGSSASPLNSRDASFASVPNVDTYFDYLAEEALRSSGFEPRVVYEYRDGYLPRGVTWGTDPVAGAQAPAGSTVTVYATPRDQPQIPVQPPAQPQPISAPLPPQSLPQAQPVPQAPPLPQPQVQPPIPR